MDDLAKLKCKYVIVYEGPNEFPQETKYLKNFTKYVKKVRNSSVKLLHVVSINENRKTKLKMDDY